jgi:hypothetical protein
MVQNERGSGGSLMVKGDEWSGDCFLFWRFNGRVSKQGTNPANSVMGGGGEYLSFSKKSEVGKEVGVSRFRALTLV